MANKKAVANGNWSATGTWDGGTLPDNTDDVYSNNFTVTIDQDITANSLRQKSGTGITAGGYFQVTSGTRVINADLIEPGDNAGNRLLLVSGGTVTINGDVTGGVDNFDIALDITSSATVTVNGNVSGGTSGNQSHGIQVASSTLTVNGNVLGGSASTRTAYGIYIASPSTVTINGDAAASTGVTYPAPAILSDSWSSPSVLTIDGEVRAGVNLAGTAAIPAVAGTVWIATGNTVLFTPVMSGASWTGTPLELSAGGGGAVYPDEADVRSEVVYGGSGEWEGTLSVPPAASVASGVPVDDTVGTAALSLADLAAVTGAQIAAALA